MAPARLLGLERRTAHLLLLLLGLLALDQAVKLAVKLNMELHEAIPVLGTWFQLLFIENNGAAFGLTVANFFNGLGEDTAKLILTLFSVALSGFIGVYLYRMRHLRTGLPWVLAVVLAGAVGNLIDRMFYGLWFEAMNDYEGGLLHGRVVDMFFIDPFGGVWPGWLPFVGGDAYNMFVFNLADAYITLGILTLLVFQGRFFPKAAKAGGANAETGAPADPPASNGAPPSAGSAS